jgi:hypothetical protein
MVVRPSTGEMRHWTLLQPCMTSIACALLVRSTPRLALVAIVSPTASYRCFTSRLLSLARQMLPEQPTWSELCLPCLSVSVELGPPRPLEEARHPLHFRRVCSSFRLDSHNWHVVKKGPRRWIAPMLASSSRHMDYYIVYGYFLFLCLNHLQPLSLLLKRFTTDKDCDVLR